MVQIKKFNNFHCNETIDMMMLPVDPISGINDFYSDLRKSLGGKLQEFMDRMNSTISSIENFLLSRNNMLIRSVESFFNAKISDIDYHIIKTKVGEILSNYNENFKDKFKETTYGEGELVGTPIKDIKGSFIQKISHVLMIIFGVNLFTFGTMGTFILWCVGIWANPLASFIISQIAILILHLIRKLAKMAGL